MSDWRALPTTWDDAAVEWDGFEVVDIAWRRRLCCGTCGSERPAATNVGRMEPKGLLIAVRCLDCRTDVVRVGKTGEFWTLDDGDYAAEPMTEEFGMDERKAVGHE